MLNKGLFMSLSPHWATPEGLYQELDAEFHFDDDPCPLYGIEDGLSRPWGYSTFVNPPYTRKGTGRWIAKGVEESKEGKVVVMLLPSRTDVSWWHEWILPWAAEIRFIKGRLKFGDSKNSAPFPSVIVVFRKQEVSHDK